MYSKCTYWFLGKSVKNALWQNNSYIWSCKMKHNVLHTDDIFSSLHSQSTYSCQFTLLSKTIRKLQKSNASSSSRFPIAVKSSKYFAFVGFIVLRSVSWVRGNKYFRCESLMILLHALYYHFFKEFKITLNVYWLMIIWWLLWKMPYILRNIWVFLYCMHWFYRNWTYGIGETLS